MKWMIRPTMQNTCSGNCQGTLVLIAKVLGLSLDAGVIHPTLEMLVTNIIYTSTVI